MKDDKHYTQGILKRSKHFVVFQGENKEQKKRVRKKKNTTALYSFSCFMFF